MSDLFAFEPATKDQAKARIALAGPSGSGKTWTALTVAAVLAEGGKVAVIDTERGSASKYSDDFEFDTLKLHHYEPDTLIRALGAAGHQGYPVCVVDSLSHFWMGTGGMLEQVDNAGKRAGSGGSFGGWKEMRPVERAMIDAMLAYPGHLIVTMRTKTEWVVEKDERTGKTAPKKIGTKPEQRDGLEYEFDVVGDMDQENTLIISKSRASALSGAVIRKPGEDFALSILEWLSTGRETLTATDYEAQANAEDATVEGMVDLYAEVKKRNLLGAAVVSAEGESLTLGEMIVRRGHVLRGIAQREQIASAQAAEGDS